MGTGLLRQYNHLSSSKETATGGQQHLHPKLLSDTAAAQRSCTLALLLLAIFCLRVQLLAYKGCICSPLVFLHSQSAQHSKPDGIFASLVPLSENEL